MSFVEILLLALALAADAFTVGAAVGLRHRAPGQIFRISWHFGVFQALMPLVGATVGSAVEQWIEPWDHWLIFGLLAFIGAKMIHASFKDEDHRVDVDLTRGFNLVGLSVAVSLDALAAGVALGLREISIALPVVIIGLVAALLTLLGMLLAGRVGHLIGKRAELVAGLVLISLGLKPLFDTYWI